MGKALQHAEPQFESRTEVAAGDAIEQDVEDVRGVFYWPAVIGFIAFGALFPSNAAWINDEAKLIANALKANDAGVFAEMGLQGSLKLYYGPFPTWLYQAALHVTENLIVMTVLKSLITAGILFFTLSRIGSILKLSRTPLVMLFLSPFLYFYGRHLWDNCFLIPTSALLFWSFAEGVHRRSMSFFMLSLCFVWMLVQIHLMSLFVVAPFFLCVFVLEHRLLLKNWKRTIFSAIALGAALYPYLSDVVSRPLSRSKLEKGSSLDSLVDSFGGIEFFTFATFWDRFFPEFYTDVVPVSMLLKTSLVTASGLAFVLFAIGLARALQRIPRMSYTQATPRDAVTLFALATLATTSAAYALSRIEHHPHYMNAVWFPFFYCIWFGFSELRVSRIMQGLLGAQVLVMALLLGSLVFGVDRNSGNRNMFYGATIGNQLAVVGEYVKYPHGEFVEHKVRNYRKYRRAFDVMSTLLRRNQDPIYPQAEFVTEYADANSGRIRIRRK